MDNAPPETQVSDAPAKAKPSALRWLLIAILAVLVAVLAALVVLIVKPDFSGPKPLAQMSGAERAAFAGKIKADIAKHMLVPEEVPEITLADDSLSELLAQGGFWKDLERGDYILIFSEDPRAVIWRPGKKLIVNVGPIINDQAEPQPEDFPFDPINPVPPIE